MKISEIRTLGTEELKKHYEETRRELFNLRFRLETRQLVNHREVRRVKRDVARISAVLKEKERGASSDK
ncbi:MAG: 50S ribosomal protein L29 [Dehalococcoidia bacterium]|nr:50S ribosomal protein L29 [Dehalococcoidia bacterium]